MDSTRIEDSRAVAVPTGKNGPEMKGSRDVLREAKSSRNVFRWLLCALLLLAFALLQHFGVSAGTLMQVGYLVVVVGALLTGPAGGAVAALTAAAVVGPLPGANSHPLIYLAVALAAGLAMDSFRRRLREQEQAQLATLVKLAQDAEPGDEARAHCERVAHNAWELGAAMGLRGKELEDLYLAGLLHDIGKVSVPRDILQKPDDLTLEEFLVMRRHARLGENLLGTTKRFGNVAKGIGAHHERWDGSGYPAGLKGTQIPLAGRILAVVDVFEALTSDRPYRMAYKLDDAVAKLREGAGTQFEPQLVERYLELVERGRIRMDGNHTWAGQE